VTIAGRRRGEPGHPDAVAPMEGPPVCLGCGRVMSNREAAEQGACNECNGGAWEGDGRP
jgi:hypothetical protein